MTGPEDSHSDTRPISVAELLARNGTIGAPPAGGRRRRRRGRTDSVTVAELTGEIPIIRPDQVEALQASAPDPVVEEDEHVEPIAPVSTNGVAEHVEDVSDEAAVEAEPEAVEAVEEPEPDTEDAEVEDVAEVEPEDTAVEDRESDIAAEAEEEPVVEEDVEVADEESAVEEVEADEEPEDEAVAEDGDSTTDEDVAAETDDVDDDYADAVAEYAAHLEDRKADDDLVDFYAPARRSRFAGLKQRLSLSDAEQMSPDPVASDDEDEDLTASVDLIEPLEDDEDVADVTTESELAGETETLPSYLRSTADPLFGGQTVADDVARRGLPTTEDAGTGEKVDAQAPKKMSSFLRGALVVGQCIIAVAFGAGLFVAFDQLWKWNNIVALVLSVLVILGLVVGVRVVRKTEDIGSTLIAVAVGALVTLGPLALLQSG